MLSLRPIRALYRFVDAHPVLRPFGDRLLARAYLATSRHARPATFPSDAPLPDGPILVFVPHPDDEGLGCGGFIARATDGGRRVRLVFVTDGAASHPGSVQTSPDALRRIREGEARDAARVLGVPARDVVFLGAPDGRVPSDPGDPGADALVDRLRDQFAETGARTFLVPWRRDPHPDHRAVAALCERAARTLSREVVRYEYAVWLREHDAEPDRPVAGDGAERIFDVRGWRARKARAILAHRSQRGLVVRDAPDGFTLSPDMIRRSLGYDERFIVSVPRSR